MSAKVVDFLVGDGDFEMLGSGVGLNRAFDENSWCCLSGGSKDLETRDSAFLGEEMGGSAWLVVLARRMMRL